MLTETTAQFRDTSGGTPEVADILECPTCGASQAISDTCRRCKCDLAMYASTLRLRCELHWECIARIRDRQYVEALDYARRCAEISPDEEAARLLAVCYLALGRYQAALDVHAKFEGSVV